MASLTIKSPQGTSRSVNLLKRVTSIGRSGDNDIVLDDPGVPETAFAIIFDGTGYKAGGETSFLINGKKTDESALNANDIVKVGETELAFSLGNAPMTQPALSTTRFTRSDSPRFGQRPHHAISRPNPADDSRGETRWFP